MPQPVRPGILLPGAPDFVILAVCSNDVFEVLAGVRDMPPATTAHGKNGRHSAVEPANLFAAQKRNIDVCAAFARDHECTVFHGDCMELLATIPSNSAQLVVTSPPYNIGKKYEKKLDLPVYLEQQSRVIRECVRILHWRGSICWQVGNYVRKGSIIPLDSLLYPLFAKLGMRMRNRIIWHFEHGLHCTRRFSGRYEVILWFTKTDNYIFNLDPIRVPQKYPGKRFFKGPRAGQYSCNPKGKNPGDSWDIPNVKHNHVEKTLHPCQFPVELIERLILGMTNPGGLVVDPFLGVGTTAVGALRHGRRVAGAETVAEYIKIAEQRVRLEAAGELRTRPMNRSIYQPSGGERVTRRPFSQEDDGELFR